MSILSSYCHIAHTVSTAIYALHHTSILHAPLLPHYRQKWIFDQLQVLTLPYVPSTSVQQEMDRFIQQLHSSTPSPSAFLLLSRNPSRFERLTRFSVVEFLTLYLELEPYIRRPYSIYSTPSHRSYTRSLHPLDQFLLWAWYVDGNDPDVLGIVFSDISRRTSDRVADHVTQAVNDAWEGEVTWPDDEERRLLYGAFTSYDKAVGVLDGTHCQIDVPAYEEGQYYSQYKHLHTQNYLICADALGFVTWTAGPFGGSDPDKVIFKTTSFTELECPMLSEGEVILVDGGFEGEGHILHQFVQKELWAMTAEERERVASFNEDFLHNRSPIEHCIHRVKCRAQALTRRWPRALHRQGELFHAATRIYNRCRRLRMHHAMSAGKWGRMGEE